MKEHGLLPREVVFHPAWLALPVCLGVAVVTSTLAALLSSLRFSLLRPARALAEAAAGRRHPATGLPVRAVMRRRAITVVGAA
ncbi:hypothetical protein ABZS96_19180 [Streptomyces avermitilis]|uniref:hypothetical protein n=1 Tax=Streptomyces avermitilis TaxID=33903 RepID=UPI0033A38F0A